MRESTAPRVEDAWLRERLPDLETGPDASRPPSGPATSFVVGALILLAIGGIAYRIWLALGPLGRAANSDEAVFGLMALHLWRDHETRAFFWHLPYGGTLNTWLMAPLVGMFGTSIFALRAVSTIEGIVTAIVTWRIARHFFKPRVALLAGVIALWWPLSLAYFSTQERQFYSLGALLGLAAVLMAVNIDEKPERLRHWFALGLFVGVGWWTSPNVIYYALPIVVYLLARGHWRHWRGIAIAIVPFLVGSSVWTYANLHSDFLSLRSPDWAGNSTYWSRLGFFFETGLPFSLGLRHAWTTNWFGGPFAGRVLYGVGIAMLLVALVLALRRIRSSASIIVLLVVMAPLIYAWFPPTWALNEGRYLYFFASLLPLLICEVLQFRVGQVVVLGFVTITALAFVHSYGTNPQGPTVTGIARALEANGYHTAVAPYWTAYILTYMSGERVIASPMPGQPGLKYEPYVSVIRHSNPAYVFDVAREGILDGGFRRALRAARIPYRVIVSGAYAAVLPKTPIPGSR